MMQKSETFGRLRSILSRLGMLFAVSKGRRLVIQPDGVEHEVSITLPPAVDHESWQVIKLRGRMGGILNLLNGMFGGGGNIVEKADVAVEKLQTYKERMVSHRFHHVIIVGAAFDVVITVDMLSGSC